MSKEELNKEELIKIECWEKAFHALGTSYVFSKKAILYTKGIRIITVLVLVVPILLGGTLMAYGKDSHFLDLLIAITAPVVIIHLVLAILALIYKWDDKLAYSFESQTDNRIISGEYETLAKFPTSDIKELEMKFEIIKAKDNARTIQDEKITFSEKENRMGMRYALYIRKKACVTCKKVPSTMTPSECETCGKF